MKKKPHGQGHPPVNLEFDKKRAREVPNVRRRLEFRRVARWTRYR